MASGKSTLAAELSADQNTVLIEEDKFLHGLFADQLTTGADYMRCSGKLRSTLTPHIATLLRTGVSVVLDFAANTPAQRAWMADVIKQSGAAHYLHLIDATDTLCLARLKARNDAGTHPFAPSEAQFHQFTKHYAPPTQDEGWHIVHHTAED